MYVLDSGKILNPNHILFVFTVHSKSQGPSQRLSNIALKYNIAREIQNIKNNLAVLYKFLQCF